ncbi:PDZ domain-containing protein [Streptomyces naphthomycinicus]|uniref:PDZ domain-containing protein n=1 Tax=Streptomyces naphthomycinicus TaxID=2872625 RepID=UPI001CEDD1C8|nr:PDZ domain-containing protein [Streptomyces sp. TML10]
MEQTALRPKPMPGQDRRRPEDTPEPVHQPYSARRRGRRPRTVLWGMCAGLVLVLSGVGIGTVGATVTGMSGLTEPRHQAPPAVPAAKAAPGAAPAPAPARHGLTLGVEAGDGEKAGALVVGVHVPGPGYTAGLIRGDVVLQFGATRVDSAADLARAVTEARPGNPVLLTVRHGSGGYQQLTVTPAVVT